MSLLDTVMEQTSVYRLWQAPFAEQKFAPIRRHNDLQRVRRVLDVGCGPGTNTSHFADSDYLGVDINESYIQSARLRHRRDFIADDVRHYAQNCVGKFDFILINSFLHHLNSEDVVSILSNLQRVLSDDGKIHILELVLPEESSIPRGLARADRGKFPRPLTEWQEIFSSQFEQLLFEPYPLKGMGITLWNMVYFQGKNKS
jgi:SAM-dependent methyltransferase